MIALPELSAARKRVRHAEPPMVRLVRAAEALFAARGIDAVSMREIATAARCGDTNAVTYYFGSKDGLLAAVFGARVEQMDPVRGRMLEQAQASGHLGDPMALLGMLLLPQLDLKDEAGAHPYAHFLLHFATQYWSLTSSLFAAIEDRAQNLFRVIGHLRALMEGVHPDVARNRILLCNMMLQSLLVRWDHMPPEDRTVPLEAHVRDVMMSARASLLAPPGEPDLPVSVEAWLARYC
ncbi:TetR/AcrR family transcriptional regulator [Sphingobium yanoikuyae]|uniref:TetR/AcrR family transcriptional regulator n=1 Tax=Sphingobium yanoikuyae TaxID=13690 RepID=UPI00056CFC82|nr:TetR/AcrR family transcriptional regulator [Sphingobium yanoikuyae]